MNAPERIWAADSDNHCVVCFDSPSLNYKRPYILDTPEALAKSDTVRALVKALALEQAVASVRDVWGRCEALEDEAADKLARSDELTDHERGFWRSQKSVAKSIRRSTEMPLATLDGLAWLAKLRAERNAAEARKTFPILKGEGASIDYQLVSDHAEQARSNHYQSVDRLAERGGLSWCELYAVLHNRKWEKIADNDAMIACRALEARYLAALEVTP